MLLLAPNIKNFQKTAGRSYLLIILLIFITYFLVFGLIPYPTVTDNYAPIYELTKLISYGRFIQRVESIYILSWLPATFMYLACWVCLIANLMKKVFNIKDFKRLIPSICVSMLSASLMLSSYVELLTFRRIFATYATPIIILLLPFAISLFATLKYKKENKSKGVS